MSAPSVVGKPVAGDQDSATGVIRISGAYPDLIVKDHGGYQSRHASTLSMLREVFTGHAGEFSGLRFDFFIGSFDNPESCNVLADIVPHVLTYSVTDQCRPNIIAIPDFIYGGWPEAGIESYQATANALAEAGRRPPRHDKLFWIGNAEMHELRSTLLEISAAHPYDMECIGIKWAKHDGASRTRLPSDRFVSLPEHADYSMLLDIRGAGYSGRLKLLMHAGRPVFLVERPFREFFFDKLIPFEHYMPVKADLSDLAARVTEVKNNPGLAKCLGQGASSFAQQYLTRDYALNYLKDVLKKIGV